MNVDTAVSRIKRGLGFRTNLDSEIIVSIGDAIEQLERGRTLPWFLETDATFTIAEGDTEVPIPSDFLREKEVDDSIRYVNEDDGFTFLKKASPDEIRVDYQPSSDSGAPKFYFLAKDALRIFPTSDGSYSGLWTYYARSATVTSGGENLWLDNAPLLVVGKAGVMIAEDLRDQAAVAKFARMEAEAKIDLLREIAARETANAEIILGGR